jgi:hypothetical protein
VFNCRGVRLAENSNNSPRAVLIHLLAAAVEMPRASCCSTPLLTGEGRRARATGHRRTAEGRSSAAARAQITRPPPTRNTTETGAANTEQTRTNRRSAFSGAGRCGTHRLPRPCAAPSPRRAPRQPAPSPSSRQAVAEDPKSITPLAPPPEGSQLVSARALPRQQRQRRPVHRARGRLKSSDPEAQGGGGFL